MGDFLGEHANTAVTILWFVTTIAIGIAGKLFWEKLTRMEKRQDSMEVDLHAIRGNYLNRFESVHDCLGKTKDEILEKIHQLHILMLEINKPKSRRR